MNAEVGPVSGDPANEVALTVQKVGGDEDRGLTGMFRFNLQEEVQVFRDLPACEAEALAYLEGAAEQIGLALGVEKMLDVVHGVSFKGVRRR
jgi:hypothetical protein